MIRRNLAHVARELRHLDLLVKVSLETRIQDLALARLETVVYRADRAKGIAIGKVDELFVDEVLDGDIDIILDVCTWVSNAIFLLNATNRSS